MDDRLLEAAASGDVATIAEALDGGANVDARDTRGRTALLVATVAGQTEAVRSLLAAGADVDLQDNQLDNPFLYAGAEGLLDILRLVDEAGADPTITNRYGGTALIPASERGHVEVVRYLLNQTTSTLTTSTGSAGPRSSRRSCSVTGTWRTRRWWICSSRTAPMSTAPTRTACDR